LAVTAALLASILLASFRLPAAAAAAAGGKTTESSRKTLYVHAATHAEGAAPLSLTFCHRSA
jgi:hypothetical protein